MTLIPGDYYKVRYLFESKKGEPIPKTLYAVLNSVKADNSGGNFTFLKLSSSTSKLYQVDVDDTGSVAINDILQKLPVPFYRRGLMHWN